MNSSEDHSGVEEHSKHRDPPSVSIIIPAYNEELRLPSTLINMLDYFESRENCEIIVVNDGSTDGTSSVVEKFAKLRSGVREIELKKNSGKGCAVRTGVEAATGELILFADADGATPIEEYDRLEKVLLGGVDVAIGSRALRSQDTEVKTSWHRRFLGQSFNRVVNFLVVPGIADTQCGFKMFQRKAAKFLFSRQRSDGFSFDVELLHIADKSGLSVVEVPINWNNIPGSKVNLILDALRMFRDVLLFRLRHRKVTPEMYAAFSA